MCIWIDRIANVWQTKAIQTKLRHEHWESDVWLAAMAEDNQYEEHSGSTTSNQS